MRGARGHDRRVRRRSLTALGVLAALGIACSNASEPATPPPAGSRDAATIETKDAAAAEHEDAASAEEDATTAPPPDAGIAEADSSTPPEDAGREPAAKEPVIFVHGIGGSSAEFQVMIDRLVADGWPRDQLFAMDFEDPRWGCNADNAVAIQTKVAEVLAATGAEKVDLVAHSMGTLSSRAYLKTLGGIADVDTYVTLGGLHHGNQLSCLNPLPVCVWEELCPTKPFLMELNADPAAPGDVHWVSICSRSDETAGLDTCHFDPAENIEVDGVAHAGPDGLLEAMIVYPEVKRVLEYPPR